MRCNKIHLLALLVTGSCGYRWTPDFPDNARPSIVVSYAKGDDDGTFTSEIVRTITSSGIASVVPYGGDFRLQISITGTQNQTIGYRKDKQKVKGKISKNIVACEARRTMQAEATIYERDSEKIAFGPYYITADTDYDYVDGDDFYDLTFVNSQGVLTTVLPFSLGQLESFESAHEAASKPLYKKLAQKIADTIFSAW